MTFMSVRQNCVLLAIEKHWPRSCNRFCVRHLVANIKRQFKGQLSSLDIWNAANKSTKKGFLEEISKFKTINEDAYNYIMKVESHHCALHAFDRHVMYDYVTNDITESFNV
ncbi:hypothetical protein Ddye_012895 [Dipteronia dyeriana]|uniref:Transposase n=1 Tax=Dipteronia dyeriana TaxID=168575 RepID=A0AAD9X5A2_9ROSI|nr:hypothetical protein Ddye_012895 [Dipteronia dyeriana]